MASEFRKERHSKFRRDVVQHITEYFEKGRILALCEEIALPAEMAQAAATQAETLDIKPFAKYFEALFSIETAKGAYDSIAALLGEGADPQGFKLLTLYLAAGLRTKELYAEKGIAGSIFTDTLKCITRFSREHHGTFGKYGFDRGWWVYRQLSLNLFRLGVLEFEMELEKNILSVHIPSDAVMTREALTGSYEWAKRFFAEHFSHFSYKDIECNTWLLSPALAEMLPPGSKILNFQADYEILSTEPDGQDFMRWVYKMGYPDIDSLPECTSLQRAVKKHLQNGGKVGNAHGRYRG
jgi:hypothetical protein